jgi:hypothetical protein
MTITKRPASSKIQNSIKMLNLNNIFVLRITKQKKIQFTFKFEYFKLEDNEIQ